MFDSGVILLILVIIGVAIAIAIFYMSRLDNNLNVAFAEQDTDVETPPVQSYVGNDNSPGFWSKLFWVVSFICSIAAAIRFLDGRDGPAVAIATAVIPYCVARAVSELGRG